MKRLKTKKSNKVFLFVPVFALVVAGVAISLIVYAMNRDETPVVNNIKVVSSNTVQIIDNSDPGFGQKEVSFHADENNMPLLLRIGYAETWMNGTSIVSNTVNGTNVVTKTWTSAFTNDFVYGNDGWYYYKKLLQPDETVQVISAIALTEPTYNAYNYDLSFYFESLQADSAASTNAWSQTPVINTTTGAVTWNF